MHLKMISKYLLIVITFLVFLSCGDNSINKVETCENKQCPENQICELVNEKATCVEDYLEQGKLRITLKDIHNNIILNADIKINNITYTTNESGVIIIDNTNEKNDIMITKEGYQPTYFMNVNEKDLIIYLNKEKLVNKAGGFKGNFDFDDESIIANGNVKFGIAGASIPSSILDFRFRDLFGMDILRNINVAGISENLPLPSNIEYSLGDNIFSPRYNVVATEESKIIWGWGGRISTSSLMAVTQEMQNINNTDEDFSLPEILAEILPHTNKFNHSMKFNQNITLCDKIEDVNDIDGDENLTELIPDFEGSCFPTIEMELNQPLSLNTTIKLPKLPLIVDKKTTSVLINIFNITENNEMIMLGMGAGKDRRNKEDILDGNVEDVSINFASKYSETSSNDNLLILTVFSSQNSKTTENPSRRSSLIKLYKDGSVSPELNFSNETYMKLAEDVTLNNNIISFTAINEASFYRINITDINKKEWLIYTPLTNISIVNKPENFSDINSITIQAISTKNENIEISYDELLKSNSTNMNNLTRFINKYSNYEFEIMNNK